MGQSQHLHNRTHGEDGIYFTYTNENPIAFNPFYVEDGVFDIEKNESIKTLLLTLWKRDDEAPKGSEEVALSNAVSAYIEHHETAAGSKRPPTDLSSIENDHRHGANR